MLLERSVVIIPHQKFNINKWLRVSKSHPCPICDKPDWCLYSPDGKAAICPRTPSDRRIGDAGWLHILDKTSPDYLPLDIYSSPLATSKKPEKIPRQPPEVLSIAYNSLATLFPLSLADHDQLRSRGLTPEEIIYLNYASLPPTGRAQVAAELLSFFGPDILKGIPGVIAPGSSGGFFTISGRPGMMIPVKDIDGLIVGFQIRPDEPNGGGKYVWLSSAARGGASSGVPAHVALPAGVSTRRIFITEGILKADIGSLALHEPFIGIAGVGNWKSSGALDILARLQPEEVVVAYDQDYDTNPHVKYHQEKLVKALRSAGYRVYVASWPTQFKGIDDFVVSSSYLEDRGKLSLTLIETNKRESKYNGDLLKKHFQFKNGERWLPYAEYLEDKGYFYVFTCLNSGNDYTCPGSQGRGKGQISCRETRFATAGDCSQGQKKEKSVSSASLEGLNHGNGCTFFEGPGLNFGNDFLPSGPKLVDHHVIKRIPCGDKKHCVLDGDTYSKEQADKVCDNFLAISERWTDLHPDQPVYAIRMTFTYPQEVKDKITFENFKDVEKKIIDRALREYYNSISAGPSNKHFWHSKEPLQEDWWNPHNHGTILNITKARKVGANKPCPCGSGKKYKKCCALLEDKGLKRLIWHDPFIDEERLKIIYGRCLAEYFDIPYEIKDATRKGKKVTYFYYIFDKKKVRVDLRVNGYIPVNKDRYIVKRGKNKGKKQKFTNLHYLHGRLRYDFRCPQMDVVDYIDEHQVKKFTEKEKEILDKLIDGVPKYWRRTTTRGWLADPVKTKNARELLGIEIKTVKKKKEEAKERREENPLRCPVHDEILDLEWDGFRPRTRSMYELQRNDVILSVRHARDGKYWIVKEDLYGAGSVSWDSMELHINKKMVKVPGFI